MIKIGVSACFLYPDPERQFFSAKQLCYIENEMANYLYRENVMPVLIPDLKGNHLYDMLDNLDGLVLQGGSDVCPTSYGEDFADKDKWPGDLYRDEYDLKIIDHMFHQRKPILGICRGAQILNVYFGGTLYQDIKTHYSDIVYHQRRSDYDQLTHPIEFMPDSVLGEIYASANNPHVNSIHHQAVIELGKDLVLEALSPEDKLIEAFSYKDIDKQFIMGVQWHPEFDHETNNNVILAHPLYDAFISSIKNKRG